MKTRTFTLPEIMFVVATRAALAAGFALLAAGKLTRRQQKAIGATLVAFGAVTTVPAAMLVIVTRDR